MLKKTTIAGAALLLTLLAGTATAQIEGPSDDRAGANGAMQNQSGTHGSEEDAMVYNQGIDAFNNKHYKDAAEYFTKYLKKNGQDVQAHKMLANTYFQENQPALAVPELEAALKLSSKDTEIRDNLGAAYLQTGSFDKAAALYHAARQRSPKDAQLALYEGLALTQAGKTDEAVVALKEAVRLDPRNPGAFLQLGVALEGGGKHAEAAVAFQSAADLSPKDPRAALYTGTLNQSLGNSALAIPYLKRALALGTDNPFAAHMSLGNAYAATGKDAEALAEFKSASDAKLDDFGAAANLGTLSQKAGNKPQAEAAYRRALAAPGLDPRIAAPVQSNLALMLVAEGKLDEASTLLSAATQGDPTSAPLQENLGLVLEKQNKTNLAIAAFHKALTLDPASTVAKESLARLKK